MREPPEDGAIGWEIGLDAARQTLDERPEMSDRIDIPEGNRTLLAIPLHARIVTASQRSLGIGRENSDSDASAPLLQAVRAHLQHLTDLLARVLAG